MPVIAALSSLRPGGRVSRAVRRATFVAAAAALFAAGAATSHAADGGVTLSDGWMRFIIAARPAAGYFTLKNTTDETKTLVGASSPDCGMVMLHRSMTKDGAQGMTDVEELAVPPHGSVSFTPGSYHLMCMDPKPAMKSAKSVPMTLSFGDGSTVQADFAVRAAGGK